MKERLSPNFNLRPAGSVIDLIVLHYTDLPTAEEALERLCDPLYEVSAHYVIAEDGALYSVVPDSYRAWHAGVSAWQGRANVNDYSIGIELCNPGHSHGYQPFPMAQIDGLLTLLAALCSTHNIHPKRVVGHSDIAPTRKQDPGHLFPWYGLFQRGYGMWPQDSIAPSSLSPQEALHRIGYTYDIPGEKFAIQAFQRHFRPSCVSGVLDAETLTLLSLVADSKN